MRNVVDEGGSAGYTYFSTEPRGWVGARPHPTQRLADDGKRLCDLIARAMLCIGWLRRIYSFRKGEVWRGMVADDGKRLCDLDRARDVVFRVAPQDNSVGRGRSGGGVVENRGAPPPLADLCW